MKKTPAEVVRVVYGVLSGRANEPRDWDLFRSCHHPGARLIPVSRDEEGGTITDIFSVDEYIESRTRILKQQDFYERETASVTTICGRVAHVLSEYDSRRSPRGEKLVCGTNTVQLVNQDGEWKIVCASWDTLGDDGMSRPSFRLAKPLTLEHRPARLRH